MPTFRLLLILRLPLPFASRRLFDVTFADAAIVFADDAMPAAGALNIFRLFDDICRHYAAAAAFSESACCRHACAPRDASARAAMRIILPLHTARARMALQRPRYAYAFDFVAKIYAARCMLLPLDDVYFMFSLPPLSLAR